MNAPALTDPTPTVSRRTLNLLTGVRSLFAHLHHHGCERDKADNRTLHFDQLLTLVMIALFQPLARSHRAMMRISDLKQVRKRFDVSHASLGSISEAARVFNPQPLRNVLAELIRHQPSMPRDPRLAALNHRLTAVDSTLLDALPRLVESAWGHHRDGSPRHKWRLHAQLDIDDSIPDWLDLTGPKNSGVTDEKAVLKAHLRPDRTYVGDRWFGHAGLLDEIVAARSDYVFRLRNNTHLEVVEDRPLTAEAKAVGVVSDAVVRVGTRTQANHVTRVVILHVAPHPKRRLAPKVAAKPTEVRLVTNLLDVPAELIGLIYQYRWTIETFFRFFKQTLGCAHLLWDHPQGIRLQTYCALIACLLMQQSSGQKPTKAMFEMVSYYLMGLADLEELEAFIAKQAASKASKTTSR